MVVIGGVMIGCVMIGGVTVDVITTVIFSRGGEYIGITLKEGHLGITDKLHQQICQPPRIAGGVGRYKDFVHVSVKHT